MKYIVDTNALIYAAKKKQDLSDKIDGPILIPNLVIDELKKLAEEAKRGSDRAAARLALKIIDHKGWKTIKLEKGHTDSKIVEYAKENGCKIYTFDKALKKAERKL
jgi:rRNA-processing protein FCF1